ncbi:hypothetical protein ACN267_11280 [Micromonospora sp. WMMD734]|uniref:HAF family extracellular repeat protein n=1 Tax=Micromonospora humidisoli TaxID=2807622 RepID=A0ABS2JH77_9ACTN|nr:hypothetical protein [Micromonospora humidisoli]MBM7085872.1 hypothetical protein [Micromonospora humidisoli]
MIGQRVFAGAAVGLLTAALALPGSAAAGPRRDSIGYCALRPLPLPAGLTHGEAQAVDPTGRFVAGIGTRITDGVWEQLLLIWQGNRVTAVDTPLAGEVTGINPAGVVIGNGAMSATYRPWRYQDGQLTELPVPGTVSNVWAEGINARGDIVGRGSVDAAETQVPLRWPADRPGTVETVAPLTDAVANAVLDDGSVVGTSVGPDGPPSYAGWVRRPDGSIRWLSVPGKPRAWASVGRGDWAAGGVDDTPEEGDGTPQRWNLRTGAATPVHPAVGWRIYGVTASGVVLGESAVGHGDRVTPLPGAGNTIRFVRAGAIADNGTVVGWTVGDRLTPVRWTGC